MTDTTPATDDYGDVTRVVDPDSKTITLTYDSYGDVASSTDPLSNEATSTYNAVKCDAADFLGIDGFVVFSSWTLSSCHAPPIRDLVHLH